ncbi:MAG: hypothetical protein U0V49_12240 [Saprospiraceae bacterium]
MKVIKLLSVFFLVAGTIIRVNGQCDPPAANSCDSANVLCSLDDVDGYTCKNTDIPNDAGCRPLCPTGGIPNNTSWWGFVTNGGNICITIEFSNCSVVGTGVQMGVYGDCSCRDTIACFSDCQGPGKYQICGNLEPCKTYYLFVDGCSGDVCDFTLRTSGGSTPKLKPLIDLEGPRELCAGACGVKYKVIQDSSKCIPYYTWTLDGVVIKQDTAHELPIDFPGEGDFVLCVSAVIGNSNSIAVCDQVGPLCANIKVSQAPVRRDTIYVCSEDTPYDWHGVKIDSTGNRTLRFIENCCGIDSTVLFVIIPRPAIVRIDQLLCKGDQYKDPTTGESFSSCEDGRLVTIPKSSADFHCDSSYLLYVTFLNVGAGLKEYCSNGKILLEAEVTDSTCAVDGYATQNIIYNWYVKSDPLKTSIGNSKIIELGSKGDYCIDITISGILNNEQKSCTFTFCENVNEDQFRQNMVCPKGDQMLCYNETGAYSTDTIFPPNVRHIWTVTNGTILTPNPISKSTIDVKWDFNAGGGLPYIGRLCYHYESDCPPSPECCIEVNVQPYPKPDAGPDQTTCGNTETLKGTFSTGSGTWTQISGPTAMLSSTTVASPTVTINNYGTYGFVLTETRAGCTSYDTAYLTFNEIPKKSTTTYICEPDQQSYKIVFRVSGGTPPYQVIKGNGSFNANNDYTSGLLPNTLNDTVIIQDSKGCFFTYIQSHECQCSNEIGIISNKLQEVCEDGQINLIYDKSTEVLDQGPNRDTVVFFIYSNPADPLGSIITLVKGNTFGYTALFNFGTQYYIGARLGRADGKGGIDLSKGCLKYSYATPFIFYQNPKPQAGIDTSVCADNFTFRGTQSVTGSVITWREKNNKSVSFTNTGSVNAQVSIRGGYGNYTFVLHEDNHNGLCIAEDEITITFNPDPEIKNVDPVCTDLGTGTGNVGRFIVMADLTTGKPPFMLIAPPSTNNGKVVGNKWVSDTLKSLDNYTIQIKDANGCVSTIISDSYNCNCGPINAGILDSAITRSCMDTCVLIRDLVPEIIDPAEDVVMYILHKGSYNNPLTVIDTFYSKNDKICFDPKTMKLGSLNPVYITRVVGDDVSPKDGIVDFNDRCRRASNNMTIVFEEYPVPDAGIDRKICGLQANFDGSLNFGNPQWTLLSSPAGSGVQIADNSNLKSQLTVSQIGVYKFILSGKNYTCVGYDTVNLEFFNSPVFIDPSVQFICDSVAENYKVVVDAKDGTRSSWVVGSKYDNSTKNLNGVLATNSNTWSSDWIPNGKNFSLTIKDANNCGTDFLDSINICACLTRIGKMDTTPLILCSDKQAIVNYDPSVGFLDPNDASRYVLYDGNPANPKAGTIIASNTNGVFSFLPGSMTYGKTYYIVVFAGNRDNNTGVNFNDRCLVNSAVMPVTWFQYPIAKINGQNLLTCTITNIILDAGASTSGSGKGLRYLWSNGDTTSTTNININGNYTVTVIDQLSGCTENANFTVNRMVDLPKVKIDVPLKLTCTRTQVSLDGNQSDKGANFQAFWKGGCIIAGGNSYQSTVNCPGTYTLVVENKLTNCRDSIDVTVLIDTTPPTARITQIGKLGCVVKEISLNGLSSTGSSGTIDQYQWSGNNINGQTASTVKVQSPGGQFVLQVRDSQNGCIDFDTIIVTEDGNPLGLIELNLQNPKCAGDNSGNISVFRVLDKNGTVLDNLTYSINSGPFSVNPDFGSLPQGTYTITVKDKDGCILAKTGIIQAPPPLTINGKSVTVDQGTIVDIDSLLLTVGGGSPDQFGNYADTIWFSIYDSTELINLIYQADTNKEILITAVDQNGCITSTIVKITVRIIKDVWWPTAINPNSGLSENAFFNLYGKRVRNIRLLNIYSRWGELVYSAENFPDANKSKGYGWNGLFRGQKALPGVYAFYAEVEFENSTGIDKVKGEFTLLR